MREIDFMGILHKSTTRDYLARVNDPTFPKAKAAKLAKQYDFDYWDGDRRINYGGYKYIQGRWEKVAKKMIETYKLEDSSKILDIGCGKGYLLYDFKKLLPKCDIFGLDISKYAIDNCKPEIANKLKYGSSCNLPWEDNYFDNLYCYDLEKSILEMERVGKSNKYICVESYRNEEEKANLLYWQVTCESFYNQEEWNWWFKKCNYNGDYSFIFFE